MTAVNTAGMSGADFVSTIPAKSCTELGADAPAKSYTSRTLDFSPMAMLAPLLVVLFCIFAFIGMGALYAWATR